jgi:hypothetical protein
MSPNEMKVGDRITFPFGKGEKEGTIVRLFQKTVYLKVDFPKHPGKLVRRKVEDLGPRDKKRKGKKKAKGD